MPNAYTYKHENTAEIQQKRAINHRTYRPTKVKPFGKTKHKTQE